MKYENLLERRFSKLLVIADTKKFKNGHIWLCKCDCGNYKEISAKYLKNKHNKSCGCYRKEHMFNFGKEIKYKDRTMPSKNYLFANYKRGANERKLNFNLTFKEFIELTSQDCYYCGVEPKQKAMSNGSNKFYIYNGIDRIDNKKGYEIDNCVTCCGICNRMKTNLDIDVFLTHINKINKNSNLKGLIR